MIAFFDEQIAPVESISVPLNDAGFTLGASVVERLRTFVGEPFGLKEHFQRLRNSLEIAGFFPQSSLETLEAATREVVATNYALIDPADDLSVSIIVTPGPSEWIGTDRERPRTVVTASPIDFHGLPALYENGQRLRTTSVRQTPEECWPTSLKCRSRIHYFLADQQARRLEPGSRAIMQDIAGNVTEATTANLLIVRNGGFRSAPLQSVLPGVTLAGSEKMLRNRGAEIEFANLSVNDVKHADEVLLTSTTPCVVAAIAIDGAPIGAGKPGPEFQSLLDSWCERAGLNLVEQARRFETR